jgi:hypothetical protein
VAQKSRAEGAVARLDPLPRRADAGAADHLTLPMILSDKSPRFLAPFSTLEKLNRELRNGRTCGGGGRGRQTA